MSSNNRRSSIPAKNALPLSEIPTKIQAAIPRHAAKKRPPLSNISNQKCFISQNVGRCSAAPYGTTVQGSSKVAKAKKDYVFKNKSNKTDSSLSSFPKFGDSSVIPPKYEKPLRRDQSASGTGVSRDPVCLDETMSNCMSSRSSKFKFLDSNKCNGEVHVQMQADDEILNVDDNFTDPQFCATIAGDIYKHLRESEAHKRPSTDFMVKVQKDITPSMRAILIDWLVEVSEEYKLVPDTLYLTVNYIDRYLSGNPMDRQRLQLLGVACMLIASKYEEVCAPQVEEFCYITDNTYFREELLQMESAVLKYLKFEMTAPTIKCFLRRFVRVAQATSVVEGGGGAALHVECLANYVAELSLVEYGMLCYAPSLIAAASVFLAKFIMFPAKRPWNRALERYAFYGAKELQECAMALHQLCCKTRRDDSSSLSAVRVKYSQHKYKFAARKQCPPSIPPGFFVNNECSSGSNGKEEEIM